MKRRSPASLRRMHLKRARRKHGRPKRTPDYPPWLRRTHAKRARRYPESLSARIRRILQGEMPR